MRQRIEDFANRLRPKDMLVRSLSALVHAHINPAFQAPIQVHAVDLGISAPRLSNARFKHVHDAKDSVRSITSIRDYVTPY